MDRHIGTETPAALAGLRVIDLTHFESGTVVTQTLAWLGADVIKVEPPGVGEAGRRASADRPDADSWYFLLLNSNKRSIQLDLKSPDDKAVLGNLIETADMFVENYGPGAIERLGFGYDVVKALNPAIIYGSIKGFGTGSPFEDFPSFDAIGQAVGGAVSLTGHAGQMPVKPGPTLADTGTGLHLVIGLLAALHQRERTGEGQFVSIAMQDAVINYTRMAYSEHLIEGRAAGRYANRSPLQSHPSDLYPCAGGGPNDWLCIYTSRASNDHWHRLLDVIGRSELRDDPRFATPSERRIHADAVNEIISAWTSTRTKNEAMSALGSANVPAGAVLDTAELLADEHLARTHAFVDVDHPVRGRFRMPGWPVRMSGSHVPITAAPILGAHTEEILAELRSPRVD